MHVVNGQGGLHIEIVHILGTLKISHSKIISPDVFIFTNMCLNSYHVSAGIYQTPL